MEHKCKFCDKEFDSGHKLGSHIRVHTRQLIVCEICTKKIGKNVYDKHKELCLNKQQIKKFCKNCNIEINKFNTYCSKSCSNKSRIVSQETKEKIRNSIHVLFPKREIPCKHCGSIFIIDHKQKKRNVCNPICVPGKEFKSKQLSKSLKGKSGGYRIGGGKGKGGYVNNIWMDSTWEIELANRLNSLFINWERDTGKHRLTYLNLNGEERKYYPDFYLPDYDLYVEVKGYWTSETKHKMNSVIERNEQVKIVILESLEEIKNFTLNKSI